MNLTRTSKYISLILRHKPEVIGITLDEHGWANVDELIAGVSKTRPLNMELLEEIIRTDEKQRYSFNEDKTLIRKVGKRHGKPVVYQIDSGAMANDGFKFFRSANNVWLTKRVPAKYLRKL